MADFAACRNTLSVEEKNKIRGSHLFFTNPEYPGEIKTETQIPLKKIACGLGEISLFIHTG